MDGMVVGKRIAGYIVQAVVVFINYISGVLFFLLFSGIICSFTAPWFYSTKVTRINTCCRFEFEITGYLFEDYTFSSTIKTSCNKTSCDNFTADDFSNQMESDIKQVTSSAESTLSFVRASPLLILGHTISFIPLCVAGNYKSKLAVVLIGLLMTTMTISATTGVAVYSTVYKNTIGFNYADLGSGWKWIVVCCTFTLIFDMFLVGCIVFYFLDRQNMKPKSVERNKEEIWTTCKVNISQPVTRKEYVSPKQESLTNILPTQLRHNKITAIDWLFVKLDDRETITDINETALYKHAWTNTDNKDMDNEVMDLPKTIKLKIITFESSKDEIVILFKKLLDNIWDQDLVGKGADAKNLSHRTLNVISVDPGYIDYNINVRKYMGYRSVILKRIKQFGKLPCLDDAHCSPIQTNEFTENVPKEYLRLMGMENLNTRLNEYFLFHGTSECNVENILNHGFDISQVRRPFLGKGIYFTEHPVKADQYTGYGSSSTGCILLCRVILGNFIIRKTNPKSNMTSWTHLPCSRCLDEHCIQHSRNERYDSLIYDQPHGMFREFVIFNTDQVLVESVIRYTRVTDSVNLD